MSDAVLHLLFSSNVLLFISHCSLLSEGDSTQLLADAETLLRRSAVHDAVLARYFEQLVTGSTAVRVSSDTLDRQVIDSAAC